LKSFIKKVKTGVCYRIHHANFHPSIEFGFHKPCSAQCAEDHIQIADCW
jgi:hypothetical protein